MESVNQKIFLYTDMKDYNKLSVLFNILKRRTHEF